MFENESAGGAAESDTVAVGVGQDELAQAVVLLGDLAHAGDAAVA